VVYSAKHREYQLVAKSTVPCFLNLFYFHNVGFPLWYAPLCPLNWGGGAQHKLSLYPPTSKPCRRLWCLFVMRSCEELFTGTLYSQRYGTVREVRRREYRNSWNLRDILRFYVIIVNTRAGFLWRTRYIMPSFERSMICGCLAVVLLV